MNVGGRKGNTKIWENRVDNNSINIWCDLVFDNFKRFYNNYESK